MTEPVGLYERLAKARAEFTDKANFKKVKTGELKFAYLPVEVAKPLVEECTAKYGVTILPMGMEILPEYTHTNAKPIYITAKVTMRLACPEGYEDMEVLAEAADYSDKCINKVYTMAYKNLIKIVFGFSEGAKDDSKYDDAREQDNDFNQGQNVPKQETKQETVLRVPKNKQAPLDDPIFGKGKVSQI